MGGGLSKSVGRSGGVSKEKKGEGKTGSPHALQPLGESFFHKSFAQELCAKAGLAPAQVRESLTGLATTESRALGGRQSAA